MLGSFHGPGPSDPSSCTEVDVHRYLVSKVCTEYSVLVLVVRSSSRTRVLTVGKLRPKGQQNWVEPLTDPQSPWQAVLRTPHVRYKPYVWEVYLYIHQAP